MEKHSKDMENIRIYRDSLQVTLKQIDANLWKLKIEKDSLSVKHNKLQRDYRDMEQILLKQQKELEELTMDISNVQQAKNEVQRQSNQKQAKMDKKLQRHMAFNEKLQKLLEDAQGIKLFNYDNVLKSNNEFKKQHTLLKVKLKALTMEENDANLWWDEVQILSRKILERYVEGMKEMKGYTCIEYFRWERSYHHFSMNL